MTEKQYTYNHTYNRHSKGGDTQAATVDSHTPIQAKPLEVNVVDNNFDKAFKIFRAIVQKERVISSLKEKGSYEKPSVKRRRKRAENRRKRFETENKRSRNDNSGKPRIKVLRELAKDREGII